MTCLSCSGDLDQIDDTTLYRCVDCHEEYDEDELEDR